MTTSEATSAVGSHRWRTLSFASARALGLGGAITSLEGDFDVAFFNPAAVELYRFPQRFRLGLALDAGSMATVAAKWASHPAWRDLDATERVALAGLAVKGLLVRWNLLDAVLCVTEAIEEPVEREGLGWGSFPHRHGSFAAARLRFKREVAIGTSVFYAQDQGTSGLTRSIAISYGVLLTSHEGLRFGLAYLRFPSPAREQFLQQARLAHGTLNLGLSRDWGRRATLSLDIRNLSDEGKPTVREVHAGAEVVPWGHLALRAGFWRQAEKGKTHLSLGFGLIDRNRFVSVNRQLGERSFALDYAACVVGSEDGRLQFDHFVTCLLRL